MTIQSDSPASEAPAAVQIFQELRRMILAGELADGKPLRQDEIAQRFGTSRYPVREALAQLEQQGLVKSVRYKGAVVAALSMQEAGEIFDLRAKLEADIMRAAVAHMSGAVLDEARRCQAAFRAARDPMEYGRLNRAFHAALYGVSGLPYHISVAEAAMDRIDRYLRAQLVMCGGMEQSSREHEAILAACAAGDAAEAAALTYAHIQGAKLSLQRRLQDAMQAKM